MTPFDRPITPQVRGIAVAGFTGRKLPTEGESHATETSYKVIDTHLEGCRLG
jgi:hypothetical protein